MPAGGLALLAPLAAHSAPQAELRGLIVGGSTDEPGFYFSESVMPAAAGGSITRSESATGSGGSYADGRVDVGFGSLHSYSDAHLGTSPGHAPQAHASSTFIDYIKPWESSPFGYTAYTLTLGISGTHSPTDGFGPRPGYTAQGDVFYNISDNRTGDVFVAGGWQGTDATPSTTLVVNILIPPSLATDDLRIDVALDTYAYVSNSDPAHQTAMADYSHTLVANLDAVTPGASTMGVSGFDYAAGPVSGVPEPATPLLLGIGIAALALRNRRGPPGQRWRISFGVLDSVWAARRFLPRAIRPVKCAFLRQ